MKTFDLTKEPDIDHDLAVQEKLDYIADLLEVALKLEYLTCK